jgi:hypothetical protein
LWCAWWLLAAEGGGAGTVSAADGPTADDVANAAPLGSFAWVTDMHLDGSRLEYTAEAFRQLRTEWKPHFVLITGDNNAHPAAPGETTPADPPGLGGLISDPAAHRHLPALRMADEPESLGFRRQRFLRAFLDEHLQLPYAIIPGDNWPQDFDLVFGPKQYSFDWCGLHFLLLAPDRSLPRCQARGAIGL